MSILGDRRERRSFAVGLTFWVVIGWGCVVPPAPVRPVTEPAPPLLAGRGGEVPKGEANGEEKGPGGLPLGPDQAAAAAKAAAHSAGEAAFRTSGGDAKGVPYVPSTLSQRRLEQEAKVMLNNWHRSAGRADMELYLGHMAQDAVFLGPDAGERMAMASFRSLVSEAFSKGEAWSNAPFDRYVRVSPSLDVAWFDERLDTGDFKGLRGTGVLMRDGDQWKIVHYSLTYTVPDGIAKDVANAIRAASPRQ